MMFKAQLVCATVLLVQSISAVTINKSCSSSSSSITIPSSGGDLQVTSVGPISPSGISVSTDLGLNGKLDISGEVPWLSAVEFRTDLPTSGSGCVDYSCGDCKSVGITSVTGGSGCCGSCK